MSVYTLCIPILFIIFAILLIFQTVIWTSHTGVYKTFVNIDNNNCYFKLYAVDENPWNGLMNSFIPQTSLFLLCLQVDSFL